MAGPTTPTNQNPGVGGRAWGAGQDLRKVNRAMCGEEGMLQPG